MQDGCYRYVGGRAGEGGQVATVEAFLEQDGSRWQVRADVTVTRDQPVVKSVTVQPAAGVPDGGLTWQVLRALKPTAMLKPVLVEAGRTDYDRSVENGEMTPDEIVRVLLPMDRFDHPETDIELARFAQLYEEAMRVDPRRPNRVLAEQLGLPADKVSRLVSKAHNRDLLSRAPKQGKAGGYPTERARRLLAEADQ